MGCHMHDVVGEENINLACVSAAQSRRLDEPSRVLVGIIDRSEFPGEPDMACKLSANATRADQSILA